MDTAKIKNNLVVSSNDLVHAKYDLTLWQKRVFVYAINQLQKDDTGFETIRMNVSDIIRFFRGSDGIKTYTAIIEAPKSLDKTIEIPYITDKGFLRYGFVKLLQRYTIPADDRKDNQYIELCFNNDLKPHLLELKEKFLKYDIENVIELQSTYSFRMFEILKTYEFRKTIDLDVDYLRKILGVTEKYKSYKDFRIYIIDKAKEDLTQYCDIAFTYEANKASKGKKVESISFHIFKNDAPGRDVKNEKTHSNREKMTEEISFSVVDENKKFEQKEPIIKGNEDEKANNMLEKLVLELSPVVVSQFGVSLKVFLDLGALHTEGEIRQAIEVTHTAIQVGKIQNIAGFFVEALKKGYQSPKEVDKKKGVEKKVKLEVEKATEQEAKNRIADEKRKEGDRKVKIIKRLISTQAPIINEAVEEIQSGMFRTAYKPEKSVLDNLGNPMFIGAMMNALEKLDVHIFQKQ